MASPQDLIRDLLKDAVRLEELLTVHGFGDRGFRQALTQFRAKCSMQLRVLDSQLVAERPIAPKRGIELLKTEPDGTTRPYTVEELTALREAGAPVDMPFHDETVDDQLDQVI